MKVRQILPAEAKQFSGTIRDAARITTWLDAYGAGYIVEPKPDGTARLFLAIYEPVEIEAGDWVVDIMDGTGMFIAATAEIFHQAYAPIEETS